MANLSISLQQPEAALSWLQQSVALWHKPPVDQDALDNGDIADDGEAAAATTAIDEDMLIEPPPCVWGIFCFMFINVFFFFFCFGPHTTWHPV